MTYAQEAILMDYLQRLSTHREGRRAIQVHLSALAPQNRRDHHLRLAHEAFDALVQGLRGQLFVLSNHDLVFIFKKSAMDDVDSALVRLRFLFAEDPLLSHGGAGDEGFITWFELETAFDEFYKLMKGHADRIGDGRAARREKQPAAQSKAEQPQRKGTPLTPGELHKLEGTLARADLSNLIRRQSICAIVGRSLPQQILSEVFVSIADLRETLNPNVDLGSSPWLFQHLTETLDRRVLAMINRQEDRTLSADVSINLNVATLLSEEFLHFDDNIIVGMRGTIVIELQKTDIFADLSGYLFARDFVRERGYRICVDGLDYQSLKYVSRPRLGADMLKLFWHESMAETFESRPEEFKDLLKANDPTRVILGRCDDENAIRIGQKLGITMFQGRFVENVRSEQGKRQRRVGTVLLRK